MFLHVSKYPPNAIFHSANINAQRPNDKSGPLNRLESSLHSQLKNATALGERRRVLHRRFSEFIEPVTFALLRI